MLESPDHSPQYRRGDRSSALRAAEAALALARSQGDRRCEGSALAFLSTLVALAPEAGLYRVEAVDPRASWLWIQQQIPKRGWPGWKENA